MADTWTAESGILRKHKAQDVEELLVFGYSCKLFRDDEKALSIDQGKHLIPWMGDEKIKIDRYDGRGALADLQSHESVAQWDYNEGLTDEERRAEQLCDEERYRSLYEHVVEEEMYREEQLKRLHQQHSVVYGQVPFNYSDEINNSDESNDVSKSTEAEDKEPYVPPPSLDIPVNMILPPDKKLSAIIERTASFIAKQGGQMEVLLKAKQQHNPQFEFLNHDNELFAFYRHILMAIKTGRYRSKEEEEKLETVDASQSEDETSTYYLHPSLAPNLTRVDAAPALPSIPTVNYKPSADCAYSMLVNKIKGTNTVVEEASVEEPPIKSVISTENNTSSADPYNNWSQYYNSEQYQEYYRQYYLATYGFDPMNVEYSVNGEIQKAPIIYHASPSPQITSTQLVTPTPPETETNNDDCEDSSIPVDKPKTEPTKKSAKTRVKIGALANYYNSDSDTDSEIEEENLVPIPAESEKLIITKMASYVAKNGKEFEEIVKGKNDPRFEFLHPDHKYHIFYKTKLNFYLGSAEKIKKFTNTKEIDGGSSKLSADEVKDEVQTKTIGPVSFSIKKPKETEHITIKPVLPIEDSSDEETEETVGGSPKDVSDKDTIETLESESSKDSNTKPMNVQYSSSLDKETTNTDEKLEENVSTDVLNSETKTDEKLNFITESETINSDVKTPSDVGEEMVISDGDSVAESVSDAVEINDNKNSHSSSSDEIQEIECDIASDDTQTKHSNVNSESECIDLTDETEERNKDVMLKNNISTSNKEDLTDLRVRQLQLDRKRRAMAFLSQLKSESSKENVTRVSETPSLTSYDDSDTNIDCKLKLQEEIVYHKSSKKRRKRSVSEEDNIHSSSKSKKSKKKSRSHSHSSRTHKHRKHSKSSHHEDEN